MNYVTNGLTGRTKTTLASQLQALAQRAHHNQDESRANKLYSLYQDTVFDQYLTVAQIKAKFARI